MSTRIRIINDTIISGGHVGPSLTSREAQTRNAFFILAFGTPLIGALFAIFTTSRWWKRTNLWSFPQLCALWFISVAAFAAIVFFQPTRGTRSTFVLAIIHGMVEISMISLLLNRTMAQSLIAAMTFALVDFTLTFNLSDIGYVFIAASILGGANDFLIPLLLFYGQQPLLAIGALAHTAAAISVFTAIVHDYGVTPFTLVSFYSLWFYVGFIVAGLRVSRTSVDEYPTNPMKVKVSRKTFLVLLLVSLVASTFTTLLLAYVIPTK